ncbi:putative anthocyanidin reductase [Magnolia sinica]|uniref:putative anthocyanidin reductase n=1 Tax=Magnolia sinica TaxID=86752 RepID=UPI00265ADCDB|nr:putative anthocyanidin reductase [Magnolia sinica]
MEESSRSKVCVTGAAGNLGSWLVKKLLEQGHTVHATLRNLDEPSKIGRLKNLPGADTRLQLLEAEIYDVDGFEPAINGCDFVFHLATPKQHIADSSKYNDTSEAAVAGVKSIVESCIRSGTVKRLIYTGSVTAASPMKEDGTGFKDSIDESCWTPLHLSFPYCGDYELAYISSKRRAEEVALSCCNKDKGGGLEVVSLAVGLVGGDTLLPFLPVSMESIISPITGNITCCRKFRFLQGLVGSIPLIHIDDVCEAHIFCMEQPSMAGRFLCASAYPTISKIAKHYLKNHKEFDVEKQFLEGPEKGIGCGTTKLIDLGFEYKHDMERILDDSVECARKIGVLN